MIEYAKVVLLGVCSWKVLFQKELTKIILWSQPSEKSELKRYVYEKYYDVYPEIIDKIFLADKKMEIQMN